MDIWKFFLWILFIISVSMITIALIHQYNYKNINNVSVPSSRDELTQFDDKPSHIQNNIFDIFESDPWLIRNGIPY